MKIEYLKGTNVISIAPIRSQVHFPSISRVEGYWEGLRNGRLMPSRSEINPRGMSDALEYAFVLEKLAPGVARLRLAGMHLNDLMGMEVRGMPLIAMFLPEARRDLQVLVEAVLDAPAKVTLTLDSDHGITRPKLEAQLILLPLKDEHGRATRILGAFQSKGKIGRGPRRFKILSRQVDEILGDEPPILAGDSRSQPAFRESAFAEQQEGFEGPTDEHRQQLRLVHDADEIEG